MVARNGERIQQKWEKEKTANYRHRVSALFLLCTNLNGKIRLLAIDAEQMPDEALEDAKEGANFRLLRQFLSFRTSSFFSCSLTYHQKLERS